MKYLKSFNESYNDSDEIFEDIFYMYLPIIDKYNLTESHNSKNYKTFYNKGLKLQIRKEFFLEQLVWTVSIEDNMKSHYGYGYDMLSDNILANMVKDASESCAELIDSAEVFVGSFKGNLSIVFFPNKPDLKKYKGCDFYGYNIVVHLSNGGYINSNGINHSNCFNVFDNDQRPAGIYSIYGYSDPGRFYNNPILKVAPGKYDEQIEEKWSEVCTKLNIKAFQNIRKNLKIDVPEFMQLLKDIK